MGQKVNPIGLRLGINRTWDSRWYATAEFGDTLQSDLALRKFLATELKDASVSRILIERSAKLALVKIISARPGLVIGKKGAGLDQLNRKASKLLADDMQVQSMWWKTAALNWMPLLSPAMLPSNLKSASLIAAP